MAKGGSKETTVSLPPEIKNAALKNLGVASNVAALPYVPNFGLQMAAFTPDQEAAFANTNQAAAAFGLPQGQGTGLPQAQNVGGFSGYSTQNLYQDALSKVNPTVKALYEAFFTPQGRQQLGADPISTLVPSVANKVDNVKKKVAATSSKIKNAPQGAPTKASYYREGATYKFGGQQYLFRNGKLNKIITPSVGPR